MTAMFSETRTVETTSRRLRPAEVTDLEQVRAERAASAQQRRAAGVEHDRSCEEKLYPIAALKPEMRHPQQSDRQAEDAALATTPRSRDRAPATIIFRCFIKSIHGIP